MTPSNPHIIVRYQFTVLTTSISHCIFADFSNVSIVVLNEPLEGEITEEAIGNFVSELCYTLVSPPSPRKHKVDIECLYALEGRYLGVIMNNADSKSFISLNEVVPILHGKHIFCLHSKFYIKKTFFCLLGKPFAFASSFINNDGEKYDTKYVIDKSTGNLQETFKSVKERYPYLAIDFGNDITIEQVKFILL